MSLKESQTKKRLPQREEQAEEEEEDKGKEKHLMAATEKEKQIN